MKLGIEGKKALVFGGSRGMGKACALQLSQEGVQVTIAARTEATLAAAAAEIAAQSGQRVDYVVADLTQAAGRDERFDDAELDVIEGAADGFGEHLYGEGICKPALAAPADADRQAHVLARLGRAAHVGS